MNRLKELVPAITLSSILLAVWEIGARIVDEMYILPSPSAIVMKIWKLKDILFTVHLPATLYVVLIGVVISIVLGVGLAMLMNASTWMERAFYPLLVASQTIPITALAPLFVLWFGYTIWSKVVVTVLITFSQLRSIRMMDCVVRKRMGGALSYIWSNKRDIFLKLKLPSALPYFSQL